MQLLGKKMGWLLICLLAGVMSGCLMVRSVTVNQIPAKKQRSRLIKAEASRPVILGFPIPFGVGFADDARKGLERKCRRGRVEGVLSKLEQRNFVLFAIQRVHLQGYCVRSKRG